MNEPELNSAAYALAEATPKHLNQPTTPPIHWELEGDILRVLLADGREVRAPLVNQKPIPAPRPNPPSYSTPGKRVQEPTQVPTLPKVARDVMVSKNATTFPPTPVKKSAGHKSQPTPVV